MPTDHKRKTDRGMASRKIYDLAAEEYYSSSKKTAYESNEKATAPTVGYPEDVFTASEEKILCDYLLNYASANFGLITKEARTRRKGNSAILTDTLVEDELAAIEAATTVKKKVKKPNFDETKTKDQNQD
ncbi:unnamed protein product [Pieris brassicae]|uniref:Uncharacterized protein n=1 Tax=Pieris brassicae TaxID=7116 RepID=A0A9P0X8A0_PIEBR|nr:unnamed protein product [Pieris brassicae]